LPIADAPVARSKETSRAKPQLRKDFLIPPDPAVIGRTPKC
jgi:hypothetical protein